MQMAIIITGYGKSGNGGSDDDDGDDDDDDVSRNLSRLRYAGHSRGLYFRFHILFRSDIGRSLPIYVHKDNLEPISSRSKDNLASI